MKSTETELAAGRTDTDHVETEPIVGGLDENIAGALAYLFAPFTGLVLYLLEGENEFVRFHALQSMIVFGGLFATVVALLIFQTILVQISFVGWIFAIMVSLVSLLLAPIIFVLWLFLIVKAYKGDRYGLPIVGGVAEEYV